MMALLWMTNPLWEAVIAPGLLIFAGWWMRDLVGWVYRRRAQRDAAEAVFDACDGNLDVAMAEVEFADIEARVAADEVLRGHDGHLEDAITWCSLILQQLAKQRTHG